jgi:tetrahydromethanopterin S-methyltransferase subunit F
VANDRQSGDAADSAVVSIDVSQVVWLRKRLGRAKLATRVAGLQAGVVVAPVVFRMMPSLPDLVQLGLALALTGSIAWAGFARLRRSAGAT